VFLGSSRTAAYSDAVNTESKTPAMIAGVFVFGYK